MTKLGYKSLREMAEAYFTSPETFYFIDAVVWEKHKNEIRKEVMKEWNRKRLKETSIIS